MTANQRFLSYLSANLEAFKPQEVVFYGGSFNPWHQGHLEAIKRVCGKHVIVIPDRNPLKALNSADQAKNIEFIKKDLLPGQFLYTGFLDELKANPTQVWLSEVKREFHGLELSLLMGFDNFAILDRWYEGTKLIQDLSRIYVLSRNNDEALREAQYQKLVGINKHLEIVFLGSHAYENVSSTKIRNTLSQAI